MVRTSSRLVSRSLWPYMLGAACGEITSNEAENGTFTVSLKVDKCREKMYDVGKMLQRNRAILLMFKVI